MNVFHACRTTALLILAWSSATALDCPACPLDESSADSDNPASTPSAASSWISSKASQGTSLTSVAPTRLAAAVHATQQLVYFLTHLSSTSDITPDRVGKQLGGTLGAEDGAFVYRSTDLGAGWNYGVKVILPSKAFKAGFNFWFYNPQRDADPAPICALSLDALRKHLVARGYTEKFDRSEIGGVDSVEFVKSDIVLTVLRSNLLAAPNGDECFDAIQTIDSR